MNLYKFVSINLKKKLLYGLKDGMTERCWTANIGWNDRKYYSVLLVAKDNCMP